MKKLFTTILCFAMVASLSFAQSNKHVLKGEMSRKTTLAKAPQNYTGFEEMKDFISVPHAENSMVDIIIGQTQYDLQSNASVPTRIVRHGDGHLSAVWTQSQDPGFADRGSGYNSSDVNSVWPPNNDMRIENERTGFTSICLTADGTEHVFTHGGTGITQHTWKAPGATAWMQAGIPHQTTPGGFWSRSAASGTYLHHIYLTMPTGNGGAIVDGMDGQLLYNRSSDGGATWDLIDVRIPGVDSTRYNGVSAEDYQIVANGDNVSIGVFAQNGDVLCVTSNDNGTTWTNNIVYDFYDKFTWGDMYDSTAIIACTDTNFYPQPNSYMTSAGHGDMVIDDNGMTHLVFASMFMTDNDFSDDQASIFNGWNLGILYWNTSMSTVSMCDAPTFVQAGFSPDLDGDGAWGHPDQTEFYTEYRYDCVSAQPSIGIDGNGQLWLVYNAPNELDLNSANGTLFRKGFVTTTDGTDYTNWNGLVPVNNEFNSDASLAPFQEHLYLAIAKDVANDSLHIIGHVDYTQGTNLNQSNTDITNVHYFAVAKDMQAFVSNRQVIRQDVDFNITPNPAANRTLVNFNLEQGVRGNIVVMDISGKVVYRSTTSDFNSGVNSTYLDVASLSNGIYVVQLNTEKFISTQKLVVSH